MQQYLELLDHVLEKGYSKKTRGIHGVKSIFGYQLRFDFRRGFPIMTTKKMPIKWMITELLWFISGKCENTKYLKQLSEEAGMTKGVDIWDGFADENGNLGPIYGNQWRRWPTYVPVGTTVGKPSYSPVGTTVGKPSNVSVGTTVGEPPNDPVGTTVGKPTHIPVGTTVGKPGQVGSIGTYKLEYIDQLQNVIEEIKTMPNSKAMIVSAWNPAQTKEMRLPPCHTFFQFNVLNGKLRCELYQRSSDVFLGLPFNITQYALLTMMIAQVTGLEARELIVSIGDAHIYNNHKEAAREQITRTPHRLPKMKINPKIKNIDDFRIGDFELIGYESHPHIKADIVIV